MRLLAKAWAQKSIGSLKHLTKGEPSIYLVSPASNIFFQLTIGWLMTKIAGESLYGDQEAESSKENGSSAF